MTTSIPTQIDEAKLEALVGNTVGELSAAVSGVLALLGDRLGLYKRDGRRRAADRGRAGRADRHRGALRRASGCTTRPPAASSTTTRPTATFTLPPEQAMIYADESSPAYIGGGFDLLESLWNDVPRFLTRSAAATGFRGATITRRCSAAPSASSAPATRRTSRPSGSRRSTASSPSSSAAGASPTSGAGTACLVDRDRRGVPARRSSSARTSTRRRSSTRAPRPPARAWRTG